VDLDRAVAGGPAGDRHRFRREGGRPLKAWGGRFSEAPDPRAADFGRSIEVDQELALDDLAGSIAHVRGLGKAGLLTTEEVGTLTAGLQALESDVRSGRLEWDPALEDVHLNLEMALAARIGPVAGKLHTGRSRNDQVATDLRLWLRRRVAELDGALVGFERALVRLALREQDTVMPGHTHVQPAQPVLLAHHLLAYVEMVERDRGRFADALRRANVSPLGSGALAGAGFPLDREAVAAELGFDGVTRNSIDAVGDRDFVAETLAAAALSMTHLSRLAEELVWWSHPRVGWVRLADAFSTGSSMMPNKRNPDPAELVRGRTSRVIGDLVTILTLLKGLPASYQRDLQEDKPPLFDGLAVLESSLGVLTGLIETLRVDREAMTAAAGEGFTTATAAADVLVEHGVPFRSAHEVVGKLVAVAERAGVGLHELSDRQLTDALAASEDDHARSLASDRAVAQALRDAASVTGALARFDVIGGTAPGRVRAELEAAATRLGVQPNPAQRE
jgi:argininosuccinate lyase